uniref:A-kinase interacting protein 1 n=1 Tax=Capra hircus TaxID=9925 RepID=A0A8C2R7W7_CAPHI
MENCLVAAALNGVDRRSLQRSARLGQEVLERAKRRAVDWPSVELPKGSVGIVSRVRHYGERGPAASPQRLLPGKREDRHPTLSASFRTMAEYMNYTSSQCGKYYSSAPEEGGATHVYRYHRGTSELHLCSDAGSGRVCILSCAVPSASQTGRPYILGLLLDYVIGWLGDSTAFYGNVSPRRSYSNEHEIGVFHTKIDATVGSSVTILGQGILEQA